MARLKNSSSPIGFLSRWRIKGSWVAGVVLIGGAVFGGLTITAFSQGYNGRAHRCAALEQELARDWVRGNSPQVDLRALRKEIRKQDRIFHSAQAKAERANCFDYGLFFGKTLRRTRKCLKLNRRIEDARRKLTRLEKQREAATSPQDSQYRRRQLIDELARFRCGPQYQREARRHSNSFFDALFGNSEEYYNPPPRYRGQQSTDFLPYATYRTMCVRKCDGYYYPVSYSALQSKFPEDADQCMSNCAAPAELFVYRNPGEDVEHMISLNGLPYSDLPNAWRYRKEYIRGCSCNVAEYSPSSPDDEEDGQGPAGLQDQRGSEPRKRSSAVQKLQLR